MTPIQGQLCGQLLQIRDNGKSTRIEVVPDQRHQPHQEEVRKHFGHLQQVGMHRKQLLALFERFEALDKTDGVLAGNPQPAFHFLNDPVQPGSGQLDEQ